MQRLSFVLALVAAASAKNIVIAGDSWGTYGNEPFHTMLKEHNSSLTVDNIAVSGATTEDWLGHRDTERLIQAVSQPDVKVVWLTLMGNDAKNRLPGCAAEGGSTKACTEKIVEFVTPNMQQILQTIHSHAKSDVRVIGFGYDILGFGRDNGICDVIPRALYPHCDGDITCFNTEFLALQKVWEGLRSNNSFVDVVNLLGSVQAGAGDKNASVGHPDLAHYSPGAYMRDNCIHPNNKGFAFIFNNLWDMYLHKFN